MGSLNDVLVNSFASARNETGWGESTGQGNSTAIPSTWLPSVTYLIYMQDFSGFCGIYVPHALPCRER